VFAGAPFLVMPWRSAMIDPAPADHRGAEAAILSLLAEREAGKRICPSEAARRLDPEAWRAAMPNIHAAVRKLVSQGSVVVTQKGAVVSTDGLEGPYRIHRA